MRERDTVPHYWQISLHFKSERELFGGYQSGVNHSAQNVFWRAIRSLKNIGDTVFGRRLGPQWPESGEGG
jgi:hypothetical protein